MTTSEIIALVEKFCYEGHPIYSKPFYWGEFAYATDGCICIRARIPGAKFCGEPDNAKKIDKICQDFDAAAPLPHGFVEAMRSKPVIERICALRAERWANARAKLRDVKKIVCPHCGDYIRVWESSGDIVEDEEYERLRRTVEDADGFQPSFPVRCSWWNMKEAIIDYKYAKLMIEACGGNGEYRFGISQKRKGRYSFSARSADGLVKVVTMPMIDHGAPEEMICEVKTVSGLEVAP